MIINNNISEIDNINNKLIENKEISIIKVLKNKKFLKLVTTTIYSTITLPLCCLIAFEYASSFYLDNQILKNTASISFIENNNSDIKYLDNFYKLNNKKLINENLNIINKKIEKNEFDNSMIYFNYLKNKFFAYIFLNNNDYDKYIKNLELITNKLLAVTNGEAIFYTEQIEKINSKSNIKEDLIFLSEDSAIIKSLNDQVFKNEEITNTFVLSHEYYHAISKILRKNLNENTNFNLIKEVKESIEIKNEFIKENDLEALYEETMADLFALKIIEKKYDINNTNINLLIEELSVYRSNDDVTHFTSFGLLNLKKDNDLNIKTMYQEIHNLSVINCIAVIKHLNELKVNQVNQKIINVRKFDKFNSKKKNII